MDEEFVGESDKDSTKARGKGKKLRKEAAKQSSGQPSKSINSDDEVESLCLKRGPRQFVN